MIATVKYDFDCMRMFSQKRCYPLRISLFERMRFDANEETLPVFVIVKASYFILYGTGTMCGKRSLISWSDQQKG
jgi:hypothetical protein